MQSTAGPARSRCCHAVRGFTLIELMAVLAIVIVLMSILVPTVTSVRRKANAASAQAQISSLDGAIRQYQQVFSAYPGPLDDGGIGPNRAPPAITNTKTGAVLTKITGAENLAIGLLGGLYVESGLKFNPDRMGRGPISLNTLSPKANPAFIDGVKLSEGRFTDASGEADDSQVPEILDPFPDPLPILYLRARVGARGVVSNDGDDSNGPVLPLPGGGEAPTHYDIQQILGYTKGATGSIGEGKTLKRSEIRPTTANPVIQHGLQTVNRDETLSKPSKYPYDAFPYFQNRAIPPGSSLPADKNRTGTPKAKDTFILICAGVDRVYGTADDITSFGSPTD